MISEEILLIKLKTVHHLYFTCIIMYINRILLSSGYTLYIGFHWWGSKKVDCTFGCIYTVCTCFNYKKYKSKLYKLFRKNSRPFVTNNYK